MCTRSGSHAAFDRTQRLVVASTTVATVQSQLLSELSAVQLTSDLSSLAVGQTSLLNFTVGSDALTGAQLCDATGGGGAHPARAPQQLVSPVTCAPVGGQHAAHCMAARPPPPRGAVGVQGGVVSPPQHIICCSNRHVCSFAPMQRRDRQRARAPSRFCPRC